MPKHTNKALFTIDLKINQDIYKVDVFPEDCLSDLINRFNLKGKQKYPQEKIKAKLEVQFRKICQNDKVSSKIKDKLNDFLQESKVIILGISENNRSQVQNLNQTPFHILEETTFINRGNEEKGFDYLNDMRLKKTYGSSNEGYQRKQNQRSINNNIRRADGILQEKIICKDFNSRQPLQQYRGNISNIHRQIVKTPSRSNISPSLLTKDHKNAYLTKCTIKRSPRPTNHYPDITRQQNHLGQRYKMSSSLTPSLSSQNLGLYKIYKNPSQNELKDYSYLGRASHQYNYNAVNMKLNQIQSASTSTSKNYINYSQTPDNNYNTHYNYDIKSEAKNQRKFTYL